MAITQISRIQVRTGNLADLPQLASGEFGLATDANRLFIGSDANTLGPTPTNIEILTSVSGAPAGGPNTSVQFNLEGNITGTANFTFDSTTNQLTLAGNIIPAANNAYDLGSVTNRWRDLYVGGNSVDIAGVKLTSNGTFISVANLEVSANLIAPGISSGNINVNVVSANTGNFASNVNIGGTLTVGGNIVGLDQVVSDVFVGNIVSNGGGNSGATFTPTNVVVSAADINVIDVGTTGNIGNVLINGDVYITSNLQVAGTTTFANVTALSVTDPLIDLGTGPNGGPLTSPDSFDRGILNHTYGNGVVDNLHYMGWKNSSNEFLFANVTEANSIVTVSNLANVRGNWWLGNVSGTKSEFENNTPGQISSVQARRSISSGAAQGFSVYSLASGDAELHSVYGDRYLSNSVVTWGILGAYYPSTGIHAGVYATAGNSPGGWAGYFEGPVRATNITTGSAGTSGTITGNWLLTSGSKLEATYADLAEYYVPDQHYEPGTVLSLGGEHEVTVTTVENSDRIAGVVTTQPAYVMNSGLAERGGVAIALVGRVPVRVVGDIAKGDSLYASDIPGVATSRATPMGCLVGRAIQSYTSNQPGIIEAQVGRP